MLVVAILVPAQAQAFKPKIIYVRATEDNEGIAFTVKVRMDKGGRDERRVSVTYDGDRKQALALEQAAAVSLRDEGLLDPDRATATRSRSSPTTSSGRRSGTCAPT